MYHVLFSSAPHENLCPPVPVTLLENLTGTTDAWTGPTVQSRGAPSRLPGRFALGCARSRFANITKYPAYITSLMDRYKVISLGDHGKPKESLGNSENQKYVARVFPVESLVESATELYSYIHIVIVWYRLYSYFHGPKKMSYKSYTIT